MDLREKIQEYIEKYKFEIISRTCDFIKIPSISKRDDSNKPYGYECARALDYCDELCSEKKLFTKNYDYHCLEATLNEAPEGKRLLLVTHADVVPVDEGGIYEPFAGRVYGDYILGRGSVDDKGPLIASIYALAFFREYHIPLKNDIRLVFGSNEEYGMDDMKYYLEKAGQPDWALTSDGDFPTENGETSRISFSLSAAKASNVEFIRSYSNGQSLVQESCEAMIDNQTIRIGKTLLKSDGNPEEVPNPVAYTILTATASVFKNTEDEKHVKELLVDETGASMGAAYSDTIFGDSILRVCRIETVGENLKLSFDLRVPYSVSLQDVADQIRQYGIANNLTVEIGKMSKGYYEKPDEGIVKLLTDLYNNEMNMHEEPYVLRTCATYTRLFRHGCDYGGGYCHEVKPFLKGHGAAHGLDEAHNIGVLFDAIKMFILGITAIDDLWS